MELGEAAKGKVLVIDDDPAIVEMVIALLEGEGYDAAGVGSGREGLAALVDGGYQAVITDLRLGDMHGIDVLRRIREYNPHIAVIILTGYATTETAVEAIRLGAADYLAKPVRAPELLKSVRDRFAGIKLAERIRELNAKVAGERDKLRNSVAELTLLKALAERMMTVLSYAGGYEVVLKLLVDEGMAEIAAIYDLERRSARVTSHSGLDDGELASLAGYIREQVGELLGVEVDCDEGCFTGLAESAPLPDSTGIASRLAVPLLLDERPVGLLVAASRLEGFFDEEHSGVIRRIAASASEFLSRIKRSVERQRHFAASVVEHTLDGILVISPATGEIMLNPAARSMLDIPSGEQLTVDRIGKWLDLDLQRAWEELQPEGVADPQQRTKAVRTETVSRGQKVFLRLNLTVLPGEESGEAGMLLVVMHDVTQEKAVEEMKNRLISNITHEVRTPTAVIKEFMSLIMDGVSGELNDNQRQYMQIMYANIERLSRLIENLLTLARSDTGGFTIIMRPSRLEPVVQNVVASMEVKLRRKNITLQTELPESLPLVFVDPDAVTQILTNLVDNAFKYSPDNTSVTIGADDQGMRVKVWVRDEGYGIPEEDRETIFQRFYRLVDENDARFQEGVGLGLSLVKDIVERHGGEIWVESREGEGSTFYFTLQVSTEDEEHRPA